MANTRDYRTLDEVTEEYYRNHPDEIEDYLMTAFAEYGQDGCTPALLAQLRVIARVKGVSALAQKTGISRNGIQKALSETGNPKFENVSTIIHAMGYQLSIQHRAEII